MDGRKRIQFWCPDEGRGQGGGGSVSRKKSGEVIIYHCGGIFGETSKLTTESHKLPQGDVGELFLQFLRFLRHVTKSHNYYL